MNKAVRSSVWLSLVLLSSGLAQTTYREAPMLAEQVADGGLPQVEERLPTEPLVIEPFGDIGQYGGTLRVPETNATTWGATGYIAGRSTPIVTREDGSFEPHLARDFKLSEDGRTITLYLREGVKWSDGTPHTAQDYLFWYEDVLLNEELTPVVPPTFYAGGEVMTVDAPDDYTVRFNFAIPNPNFLAQLAINGGSYYQPQHYLSQFHADFADPSELQATVDEAGYENWGLLFNDRMAELGWGSANRPAGVPTMYAYNVVERGTNTTHLERNPFFWMVDPEGNQLPYIDALRVELVTDAQVLTTMAINGEFDIVPGNTNDLPLYVQNAERSDYRVLDWKSVYNEYTIFPNQTHVDKEQRDLLQNPRFRQALSLAIDRTEINEVAYLGLGTETQATAAPGTKYYREEFANAYASYDPEQANQLLDDMGLMWDSNEQYRLRPDGKRLSLQIEVSTGYAPSHVQASELVVDYWRAIGIDASFQVRSPELFEEIGRSSDFDVRTYGLVTQPIRWRWLLREWVPTEPVWSGWSTLWSEWYVSDGNEGMVPPPRIMRLYELHDTWNQHPDEAVRDQALMDILEYQAENINLIGTVAYAPFPILASNRLHNVPEGLPWFWDTGGFMSAHPWAWYIAGD